jgi:cytochrome c-type biogenesis protein CcmH
MTKDEIKAALVAEYGPDVLAEPEASGFGAAAWLVPVVLALAGALGVALLWRRWRAPAAAPAAGPEIDDSDARRLDAELAAYDR